MNNRCCAETDHHRIEHQRKKERKKERKRGGEDTSRDDLFEKKINTMFSSCYCRHLMVDRKMPSSSLFFLLLLLLVALFRREKDNGE